MAGRFGGPGYDGGHAGPSALGFIGDRAGLFPQHEWQNGFKGAANDVDGINYFHTEKEVIGKVKKMLSRGENVDLEWEMNLAPGGKPEVPSSIELGSKFGNGSWQDFEFNNLPRRTAAID